MNFSVIVAVAAQSKTMRGVKALLALANFEWIGAADKACIFTERMGVLSNASIQ